MTDLRDFNINLAQDARPDVSERTQREVVLLCYCCVPFAGSESGAGWIWAKAASKVGHVTLITSSSTSRRDIEQAFAEENSAITVCWVNTPRWLRALLPGKVLGAINYCVWQALAAVAVRRLERRLTVDAVHHVTFASDSLPSALLASRAPVRIWGPVGGATRSTFGLYRYMTARGIATEIARDTVNGLLRATCGKWLAHRATLIVALNNDVRDHWRRGSTPVVVESHIGLERSELGDREPPTVSKDPSNQRTAFFVARLIPWKGLLLAIESLRYAPDWKLVVLGEGPDRKAATLRAARIGVADRVEFRGQVPRAEVLLGLRTADCLLFPSFHDSSPWAVGEATAQGCPVVCLDAGGPALQAGRNAHVVPIDPERSLPIRIGECLQGLADRGVPDEHLVADRIPVLLEDWYCGRLSGDSQPGRVSARRAARFL